MRSAAVRLSADTAAPAEAPGAAPNPPAAMRAARILAAGLELVQEPGPRAALRAQGARPPSLTRLRQGRAQSTPGAQCQDKGMEYRFLGHSGFRVPALSF